MLIYPKQSVARRGNQPERRSRAGARGRQPTNQRTEAAASREASPIPSLPRPSPGLPGIRLAAPRCACPYGSPSVEAAYDCEGEREKDLSQGRRRVGDGRERRLLRRRTPAIRLRPPPHIFRGGRDGVDGVDREGALLRPRAAEGQRRAPFLRFDACAGGAPLPSPGFHLQEECLQRLQYRIEAQYDSTKREHQEALNALWCASFPGTELRGLISEQWKEMGWQGKDPSTYFRGGGFISLENLLYFARNYPKSFQELLRKQNGDRTIWEYPFAVAGVNITFMLTQMFDLQAVKPRSLFGAVFLKFLSDCYEIYTSAAGKGAVT